MGRWNAKLHPRDAFGRFTRTQSVRVSTRSVSYNVGARTPIGGGRAKLYVGAIVRVERADGDGAISRAKEAAYKKIAAKVPNSKFKTVAGHIASGQTTDLGKGVKVNLNRQKPKTQLRVASTQLGSGTRKASGPSYTTSGGRVRAARAPRKPRAKAISGKKALAGVRQ